MLRIPESGQFRFSVLWTLLIIDGQFRRVLEDHLLGVHTLVLSIFRKYLRLLILLYWLNEVSSG